MARSVGVGILTVMAPRAPDYGTHALAAAMTFAVAVAVFAYGGSFVDDKLGTSPVFLVTGCLLGVAGGMLHMISRLAPGALPFGRRGKNRTASQQDPE